MTRAVGDRSISRILGRTWKEALSDEPGPDAEFPLVRETIADSWRRSELLGVDRDDLAPRSSGPPTSDAAVLRCVEAVLTRNAERLVNEPVSLIFASPDGSVIHRLCGDSSLARKLDSVHLAPGSGYDEQSVGTNGIGTAIENIKPMLVHGEEHYNERLSMFTCAGNPVFHPVTGSLVGIVDITCYAESATALLMTTASMLADQIEQSLLATASPGETQLLQEYLSACRYTSNPVIAQGKEVVMMNRHAQQLLTPEDRASLLFHSADFTETVSQDSVVADLPSGLSALLSYKPSTLDGKVVGGIVRVRLNRAPTPEAAPMVRPSPLTGLVGSSTKWIRATELALGHAKRGTSVIFEGEADTGRTAIVQAAHLTALPTERLGILDCSEVEDIDAFIQQLENELDDCGTLLLREIDRIPEEGISAVSELLVEQRSAPSGVGPTWIVATRTSGNDDSEIDSALVPNFDVTVAVPPLRHRPDDISKITVHLLRQFDRENRLSFDDAALRHLSRLPWYGNLKQLRNVVRECVRDKRAGVIGIDDLPAECDSSIRRSLTPIESLQRDAIVAALRIYKGRKPAAAEHLGMSRATIYRKIREFGIEVRQRRSG